MNDVQTLLTIKEFMAMTGLSRHAVGNLIRMGKLEYVSIGARKLIPGDAWACFLEENRTKQCPEETKDRAYDSSKNAASSTSVGLKVVAAGSAARAQLIANKLKSRSRISSTKNNEKLGHVLQMKS